ncbi:MAG: dUTP diphosphatase [Coriobacteriales bacterium]|jgi:dUTP pyrophosphatase|nr:dUTP diphosphatase [Coriobacteriales bacterium]
MTPQESPRSPLPLPVQRLNRDVPLPHYAYAGDAGLDLCAAADLSIAPQQRALIPTGLKVAIPVGYAGFVLPRSGLAIDKGLTLVNSPGLIDSHYRGEVKIIALNTDVSQTITVHKGERIAQLVVLATPAVQIQEREVVDNTSRGSGGFGSSGR